MTSLSDAALDYAARGWPVFPLVPGLKSPLTKHGFKDATTNADRIEAWWDWSPNANIGLRTGIAFDVLDIDSPFGVDALRAYINDDNFRHNGPVALTGNGWHLLFLPSQRPNGAGLLPKIDFRGTGGYIVAPPSLHPLGHRYRWDPFRNENTEIPEAPPWLLTLLERLTPPESEAPTVLVNPNAPDELGTTYLPRWGTIRLNRPNILLVCEKEGIPLKPHGHYWVGRCPFKRHKDTTPSFTVYPSDNSFYCYGCQAYGDSFNLEDGNFLTR